MTNAAHWIVLASSAFVMGACSGPTDEPTPAERTSFLHAATFDEAVQFLNALAARHARMELFASESTAAGRRIPVVILASPMVRSGAEAHASGRSVVYVEASMAGGEVDGTDGMLALIRDLVTSDPHGPPTVLDSVVVVVVPVANPDGNEARGPVAQNRPDQRGPDTVGTDPNAQGLTLNRDFVKTEAPETRNTLGLFRTWDPDVYVELHTNDGSLTGFAYTYAPTLHPASLFAGPYTRDSILPELQRRLRDRHALESFDYGTFVPPRGPAPDTAGSRRWETFDYRARYGTNYAGLRNRIAILGVSYAHDTFERRILEQEALVREILSIVAERGAQIRALTITADSSVKHWSHHRDGAPALALAATVAEGIPRHTILAEDLVLTGDSARTQSGVPPGVRRTGHYTPLELPVWNRFEATRTGRLPLAWLLPPGDTALVSRLALHGIRSVRLDSACSGVMVQYFVPDSIVREKTVFQGHYLEQVFGRWRRASKETTLVPGAYVVSASQPLGVLALQLLDPESADGFATWNVFDGDPHFRPGGRFPIARISEVAIR